MTKSLITFTIIFMILTGCVAQQAKITPIGQVIIPPLNKEKSRIYFLHAGNISIVPAKIVNATNGEVLTVLSPVQCTYIDVNTGIYKFRAGHTSLGPNELVTEISVNPGNTYYMVWWWNRDRRIGFHGSERGSHFMNLKSEQGKKMISHCNYKETNLNASAFK